MPKDFDLLAQLGRFAQANGVASTEPDLVKRFAVDNVTCVRNRYRSRSI